ncbi:hypothetical protein [Aporhodopirellula aestuarii]|uniref:General secretion pathway protein GspI n=1 Tax=Aporhodopirellula aestuarii TaxID=2950107 RepID=A0ABT0U3R6_9BACT|nr:hypothetical protein [Aporhodopirellula aestuarii]MCM2371537.1 hypothetical protein [Aporhodopirellula aestuarii]
MTPPPYPRHRLNALPRRQPHRGAILLAVLVCLVVASAITGLAMQTSLRARHQMKVHWQLEQTRMLLDVGIRRTLKLAAEDVDYEGESWVLDDAFETFSQARVEIKSLPPDESNEQASRRFEIIATIHNLDSVPVQTKRSRIIPVQISSSSNESDSANNGPSDNS